MIKNFFTFATKETTQDSMLCWIFENWQNEDFKDIVCTLLDKFSVKVDYDKIINIKTFKQVSSIDVIVVIETTDKHQVLIIEDKTDSNAHTNQLLKYDSYVFGGPLKDGKHDFKVLETINAKYGKDLLMIPDNSQDSVRFYNFEVHRVFYKTSWITDTDKLFIKECTTLPSDFSARQEASSEGWKTFDISIINDILTPLKDNKNMLLSMYVEHINECLENLKSLEIPKDNNIISWYNYLNNVIVPYFKEKGYLVDTWNWNGKESGLAIKCKTEDGNPDWFDDTSNECICVAFYNKCWQNGLIKFVCFEDKDIILANVSQTTKLKEEIKRMNDTFGTTQFPLVIKDSYMKPESKTFAAANLPVSTTEELINSLEMAAKQLAYIEHDLKTLKVRKLT